MERTRGAIVNAFIQLLSEKPVNKITVKDIVERCGVNRNTFYYHFHDIPDLAEQMMEEKADQLIQNHYQPHQPIECIRPLVRYGLRHRTAVLHIYQYLPRDTFLAYLNRLTFRLMQEYFTAATDGLSASGEDVAALARFYRCAMVGLLLDWLDGGMQEDMLELSERLCSLLQGTGRKALTRPIRIC